MLASAWQPSGNIILLVSEGGLRTIRDADRGEDVTLLEYEYSLAQKLKGKKRVMLLLVKDKSGANFSSFSTEVFPGGEVAKVSPTRSTLTNLSIQLSLSLSLSLSLHTYICACMHACMHKHTHMYTFMNIDVRGYIFLHPYPTHTYSHLQVNKNKIGA